jgi:hypothetical protein
VRKDTPQMHEDFSRETRKVERPAPTVARNGKPDAASREKDRADVVHLSVHKYNMKAVPDQFSGRLFVLRGGQK